MWSFCFLEGKTLSDKITKRPGMNNTKRNGSRVKQHSRNDRSVTENELFDELLSLISVKPGLKLDKASILRHVIAYLKSRRIVDGDTEADKKFYNGISKDSDSVTSSSDSSPGTNIDFHLTESVVTQLISESGNTEKMGMFDNYKEALERGMRDFLAGSIMDSPKIAVQENGEYEYKEKRETIDDISDGMVKIVDTNGSNLVMTHSQPAHHGQTQSLTNTKFAAKEGRLSLKASHSLMLMMDNNLCITFVSDNVTNLLGHQSEKMLGRKVTDYMDPYDARELDRHLKDELLIQGNNKEEQSSSRRVLHYAMKYSFPGLKRNDVDTGHVLTQWSMVIRMKQDYVKDSKVLTSLIALCEIMKPDIKYLPHNIKMFVLRFSLDFDLLDGEWDKVRCFTGYSREEYIEAMKYKYYIEPDAARVTIEKKTLLLKGEMVFLHYRFKIATGKGLWMKCETTMEQGKDYHSHQIVTKCFVISESDIIMYMRSKGIALVRRYGCKKLSLSLGSKKPKTKRLCTETAKKSSTSFDISEHSGFPVADDDFSNKSLDSWLLQEKWLVSNQPMGGSAVDTNLTYSSRIKDSDVPDWFNSVDNSPHELSPIARSQDIVNVSHPASVSQSSDLENFMLSDFQQEIHAGEELSGKQDDLSDNPISQTLTSLLSSSESDIPPHVHQFIHANKTTICQQSQVETTVTLSDFNVSSNSHHKYSNYQNFSSQSYNFIFDNLEINRVPVTNDIVENNPVDNWRLQQEVVPDNDQRLGGMSIHTSFGCSSHITDSDIQDWLDSSEKPSTLRTDHFCPVVRDQEVVSCQPEAVSEFSDLDDLNLTDLLFFNQS